MGVCTTTVMSRHSRARPSSWLPLVLEKAEGYLELYKHTNENIGDPKEVFYKNCFIAFEGDEEITFRLWDLDEDIGLWSSDMPHLDAADVWEAMDAMNQKGLVASFVVDRNSRYLGVVSFAAAAEAAVRGDETLVNACMDNECPTLVVDTPVESALPIVQHAEGTLPVTDGDGRLVGTVQPSSVMDAMAQEALEATEAREAARSVDTLAVPLGGNGSGESSEVGAL